MFSFPAPRIWRFILSWNARGRGVEWPGNAGAANSARDGILGFRIAGWVAAGQLPVSVNQGLLE
jgi:hypothetical protein